MRQNRVLPRILRRAPPTAFLPRCRGRLVQMPIGREPFDQDTLDQVRDGSAIGPGCLFERLFQVALDAKSQHVRSNHPLTSSDKRLDRM